MKAKNIFLFAWDETLVITRPPSFSCLVNNYDHNYGRISSLKYK